MRKVIEKMNVKNENISEAAESQKGIMLKLKGRDDEILSLGMSIGDEDVKVYSVMSSDGRYSFVSDKDIKKLDKKALKFLKKYIEKGTMAAGKFTSDKL